MIVCLEGHLLGYFARHLGEMTRQRDSKLHNMFILADVSRCWDCHDPISSVYNELERYEYGIWKQKELIPQSWSWLVS